MLTTIRIHVEFTKIEQAIAFKTKKPLFRNNGF